jgi:endonuclease III related protein
LSVKLPIDTNKFKPVFAMKTKLLNIYNNLLDVYGHQDWWPGNSPWEICVGAVLTQNTNWFNVEKAITNLKNGDLISSSPLKYDNQQEVFPVKFAETPIIDIEEMIRPSGYFRLKAGRMMNVVAWWLENVSCGKLSKEGKPLEYWRDSLLSVNGVGPETADSILLYAFDLPSFVIDTYTKRIMSRHLGTANDIDYHELRTLFMNNLPNDAKLFNEYHALIVQVAKEACLKRECLDFCPLR